MNPIRSKGDFKFPHATGGGHGSLSLSFRKGRMFAAYLELGRRTGQKSARTVAMDNGLLVIDYDADGAPMGVEITAPSPDMQRDIRVTQDEIEEVLHRAIKGRNSARDTLIFKLRFFEGMGPSEIAKSVGGELTALAVSSILSRVVNRIRPILARKYGIRLRKNNAAG